jgi:hypothetical protein
VAHDGRDARVRSRGTGTAPRDTIRADRAKEFTHEKMFIRFRPYDAVGRWDGLNPLADVAVPAAA